MGKGGMPSGAAFRHFLWSPLENAEPPDTAADENAHVLGQVVGDLQTGILEGFPRGGDGEVDEIVHLLQLSLLNKFQGVEVFGFSGEFYLVLAGVEASDVIDAAAPGDQTCPGLLGRVAERADQPDAGDDDSLFRVMAVHGYLVSFC